MRLSEESVLQRLEMRANNTRRRGDVVEDKKETRSRRTLGLLKHALLDTDPEGLVEKRVEHGIRGVAELVVGLDILLERLAAVYVLVSFDRVGLGIASCSL